MRRLGLIINPIAGMGGQVGLKGTDGTLILQEARARGAKPQAADKTLRCLNELTSRRHEILWLSAGGEMGEDLLRQHGWQTTCLYQPRHDATTADDTFAAAQAMQAAGAELILFAGGDGTARVLVTALGTDTVVVGIPAGVKIYSPVFGTTPEAAGQLVNHWLQQAAPQRVLQEVLDLDEERVRRDEIFTELFGYLQIPEAPTYIQNRKAPTPLSDRDSQTAIALDLLDQLPPNRLCVIGPGSTPAQILEVLGLPATLMGVDILLDGELVARDCAEADLLKWTKDRPFWLVLTPTGGQGYLLGRGNQQISPAVLARLDRSDLQIVATRDKLLDLGHRPLRIDTGDPDIDRRLAGYYRVRVGYRNEMMARVVGPVPG